MRSLFTLFAIMWFSNIMISQCANRSLHFDQSHPDYLSVAPNPYSSNGDFTIECWFYAASSTNLPSCDTKILLAVHNTTTNSNFSLYDCNGDLYIDIFTPICSDNQNIASNIRNSWHHLAIKRSSGNVEIVLDCTNVIYSSVVCPTFNIDGDLYLGSSQIPIVGNTWKGEIDEIKLWTIDRNMTDICDDRFCPQELTSTGLLAYYPADQGVAGDPAFPANDNSTISTLDNVLDPSFNGILNGFGLVGQTSNFICSSSPMIYPIDAIVHINDYATQSIPVLEICSGDPLHFCLLDNNNQVITQDPSINVVWQYDDGTGFQDFATAVFSGTCFGVPPGELIIDCSTNNDGFENWMIRAKFEQSNTQSGYCEFFSNDIPLKICCLIEPLAVNLSTNYTNDLLCAGDAVNYSISINSPYPFINIPASGVTIDWEYIRNGSITPLISFQNSTSFAVTGQFALAGQVCFKATVINCNNNKPVSAMNCLEVDQKPICGSISASPDIGPLTQTSSSPLVYELCPGDAAILNMDNGFSGCNPIWEYSFDPSFTTVYNLGSTNTSANTNGLPANNWPPTATSIYYRVVCNPSLSPSGCDPCISNTIEIQVIPSLLPPQINGPTSMCNGASATWQVNNPITGVNYEWYCEGILTTTGTQLSLNQAGCCFLRATDNCSFTDSPIMCLTECFVFPKITCPLAPNICPKVGDIVYLSACNSLSTCSTNLSYNWAWDSGTLVTQNSCDLQHIPIASGTTYSVTVTDIASGCTAIISSTVIPCP